MKKLFLISAFLIFACSSDDSSNTNDDNQFSIIDKWCLIELVGYESDNITFISNYKSIEVNGCRSSIEFKNDGTYLEERVELECNGFEYQATGNWELNGNILTVFGDDLCNGNSSMQSNIILNEIELKLEDTCCETCDYVLWHYERFD